MAQSMVGRLAIKAKQIQPGDAFAAAVPAGGLVEIVDLEGRQVAELVAFSLADPSEHVSLGVTRQQNQSIVLSLGMKLYSSRGRSMLELVEDTVGRHDLLWAAPTGPVHEAEEVEDADSGLNVGLAEEMAAGATSPVAAADEEMDAETPEPTGSVSATDDGERDDASVDAPAVEASVASDPGVDPVDQLHATSQMTASSNGLTEPVMANVAHSTGFAAALSAFGLSNMDAPDPVNFFMQLAVMQKGDLELRPPLSERGDRVILEALTDLIVAVRCSAATDATNDENPTDVLVRVYR